MRRFVTLFAALLLAGFGAAAQESDHFVPAPVTVTTDMVRVGDHLFYAHVVRARQTLYSIGKAYGVSSLDIIDANPKLDLRNRPIHPGDVLLIPVRTRDLAPAAPETPEIAPDERKDSVSAPKTPEIAPNDSLKGETAPKDTYLAPIAASDSLSAPKDTILAPADTLTAPVDSLLAAMDTIVVPGMERPEFVFEPVEKVHVALLLPLAAETNANPYYLNFYFGAMLAARDLGDNGVNVDLTVLDISSNKDFAKVGKVLEQSDVIIGPVGVADINRTLPNLPEGKMIVSPMDPKTEALVEENPVILAATPASTQIEDAVAWMKSNMQPADSLIIVKEAGFPMTANSKYLIEHIDPSSIENHINVSYALSEGIKMNEDFFMHHTHLKDTVTWVVAASEHDVFVKDVIRNVALQNYMGHNVYIYGPAKTKGTDMDEMCGARLHQSATYFIDYDDSAVIRFVKDFRALFQAEPDNFAFHGYDTMKYFVSICNIYGRNWPLKLDAYKMNGLQTNFRFFWDPATVGFTNAGIRRVVYSPGFQVEVIR
ncbi:MAG: LysM peptidoglycan-binding domain-containing protein [Bacteroidales bacterium]|nr:LysM peptidoglycan-binding domain-containing protein [Bacteroidales bacterium]